MTGWRPQRLGSVTLTVPDPQATADFLATGLQFAVAPRTAGGFVVTTGGDYGQPVPGRTLTLLPGQSAELVEVCFDVDSTIELDGLPELASKAGMSSEQIAADDDGGAGVALTDLDGLRLVVRLPGEPWSQPLPPSAVRPRRLGHLNLSVTDPGRTASMLAQMLGLRLSEQIGQHLFFLRLGSEHHTVGVRPTSGDRAGIHHLAYEVPGWESYRVICDHLADQGHTIEYGPGRHIPGHSLFAYVRDPSSGVRLELFSDMAHIDNDEVYEPIRWEISDRPMTINRWGPGPPDAYLAG